MNDRPDFQNMMQRIRSGDAEAAAECVRLYEQEIRRAARVRLSDPRLRRIIDSMDICQSVFGRFFLHAASGSLEMESPEQLLMMLVTMTRNRVADAAREQTSLKRDHNRNVDLGSGILNLPSAKPGPGSQVAAAELLAKVREQMSPEERIISDRRHAGDSWQQLADQLKSTPDALRKQMERAIERIRESLGIS